MKTLSLFSILLFSLSVFSQERQINGEQIFSEQKSKVKIDNNKNITSNLFTWEDEIDISNNIGEDSRDARMCIGNDGTIHCVYTDRGWQNEGYASGQKIVYTKKELGQAWTAPIVIDENGYPSRNNGISAIAVDNDNNVHVVFLAWAMENWRFEAVYTKFDNNSQTWSTPIAVSTAGGSIYDTYPIQIVVSPAGNPLVVWGEDNRVDENTEELYASYFDGTSWSQDVLLSGSDTLEGVQPVVELVNNKAMIVFKKEVANEDSLQLQYGFFDFNDNTFSAFNPIPNTKTTTSLYNYNYDLENVVTMLDNNVYLASWTHEYPVVGDLTDKVSIIKYDVIQENFSNSEYELNQTVDNYLYKVNLNLASNSAGEIAVVMNDMHNYKTTVSMFNPSTGFSAIENVSTEPEATSGNTPSAMFDANDKLNVIYQDDRENTGSGYIESEVYHRVGTPIAQSIDKVDSRMFKIYPNPAKNQITIDNGQLEEKLQIIDITGKTVITSSLRGGTTKQSIDITTLDNGIYFVKINNSTQKLIKQ